MKSHYSNLIAISLAALLAVSCSDSQDDLPVPVADPSSYILFSTPTLNLGASVSNFASRGYSEHPVIDRFQVWGFCMGRNVNGNEAPSTITQEWDDKSGYFTNKDTNTNAIITDLEYLNGSWVDGTTGLYGANVHPWDDNTAARYSFIGCLGANFVMQPSGTKITYNNTTPATEKTIKGPSLKIHLDVNSAANLDYTKQPDVMVAATFDKHGGSGRVDMSFMHLMTGIRFKFHNHTKDPLIINSVTYAGSFFKTAYLDFTRSNNVEMIVDEASRYTGTFSLLPKAQEIAAGGADFMAESIDAAGNIVPSTLLLLPNPAGTTETDKRYVLGFDKVITITYQLGENGETRTFTYPKQKPDGSYEDFTLSYKPQPNTLHTAHFNFVGDEFIVVFQADDTKNWENGSDLDLTIK